MTHEFKGTPGKWDVASDEATGTFVRADGLIIAKVRESLLINYNANANLIAAAPELLEACMKLAEWDKKHPAGKIYPDHEAKALEAQLTQIVTAARAAISKALNQEV